MTDIEFTILSRAVFLHENDAFHFDDSDDFWEQERHNFDFTISDFTTGFDSLCGKEYIVDGNTRTYDTLDSEVESSEWSLSDKGKAAYQREIKRREESKADKMLDRVSKETSIYAPRKANTIAIWALIVAGVGIVVAVIALFKEDPKPEQVDLKEYVKKEEVQKMIKEAQIEVLDEVYGDTSIVNK